MAGEEKEIVPTAPAGEQIQKSTLHIMWGGVWVPLGDVEFLTRDGEIIKVISYTPRVPHEGT